MKEAFLARLRSVNDNPGLELNAADVRCIVPALLHCSLLDNASFELAIQFAEGALAGAELPEDARQLLKHLLDPTAAPLDAIVDSDHDVRALLEHRAGRERLLNGKRDQALEHFARALACDPALPRIRGLILHEIAFIHTEWRQHGVAIETYRTALTFLDAAPPKERAVTLRMMALSLMAAGDTTDERRSNLFAAEEALTKALHIAEGGDLLGYVDLSLVGMIRADLAIAKRALGAETELGAVRELLREAREVDERAGRMHPFFSPAYRILEAETTMALGLTQTAAESARAAWDDLGAVKLESPADRSEVARLRMRAAELLTTAELVRGDAVRAERWFRRFLKHARQLRGLKSASVPAHVLEMGNKYLHALRSEPTAVIARARTAADRAHFNTIFSYDGGWFDPGRLDDPERLVYTSVRNTMASLIEHVPRSVSVRRPLPRFVVGYLGGFSSGIAKCADPRDGVAPVGFHLHFVGRLEKILEALTQDSELVRTIVPALLEVTWETGSDVGNSERSPLEAEDREVAERSLASAVLLQAIMNIVALHEVGHVLHGHVAFKKTRASALDSSEAWALESDADVFAARQAFRSLVRPYERACAGEVLSTLREVTRLWMIGQYLALRVMTSELTASKSSHPHALHRLQSAVACVEPRAGRLGMSADWFRQTFRESMATAERAIVVHRPDLQLRDDQRAWDEATSATPEMLSNFRRAWNRVRPDLERHAYVDLPRAYTKAEIRLEDAS